MKTQEFIVFIFVVIFLSSCGKDEIDNMSQPLCVSKMKPL